MALKGAAQSSYQTEALAEALLNRRLGSQACAVLRAWQVWVFQRGGLQCPSHFTHIVICCFQNTLHHYILS